MTTTTRSAAVCTNLARARPVYADDGTAAVVVEDKRSIGTAFADCS